VAQLLAQRQGYQEETVGEMQRLKELQTSIRSLERELKERRTAVGGSHGQQQKSAALDRKIKTWQGRLEQANKKYSQQLAENSSLRETIDHLKAERKVRTAASRTAISLKYPHCDPRGGRFCQKWPNR